MSGALTRSQLLSFEQQIGEQLEQLQQEEHDLLEGMPRRAAILDEDAGDEQQGELIEQIAACREALVRIEAGQYGYCDRCGEVIELNHLMADPAVCRCVRCRRGEVRLLKYSV